MNNSIIVITFLLLATVNLISSRVVDNPNNSELSKDDENPNAESELSKNETLGRLEELEMLNLEYKQRLSEYEKSDCQKFTISSDIYIVRIPGIEPFAAPCEAHFEDGGWTVIQRRLDGSVDFQRSWNEYRNGFGDLRGEFFIGLEKLHQMTAAQPQELLIYYELFDYRATREKIFNFLIGSENEEYVLKSASSYNFRILGNAVSQKFTTYDRDNDEYWIGNCAKIFKSGWWFGKCIPTEDYTNLNAPYVLKPSEPLSGIVFNGQNAIRAVQMMIRPRK